MMVITIPLKPLVSAPFRIESDISVVAAKSIFDPAAFNCTFKIHYVLTSALSLVN